MLAGLSMERERKDLSEAIVDVLESWPELDRQVFTKSHYQGESADSISNSEGLSVPEVRTILDLCNRKLRQSLSDYRRGAFNRWSSSDHGDQEMAPSDYLH
jgi:DNA-directed RNA polymerase specialized sigma24 family protein